ncbi:MAG: DNA-binding protein, partial [Caulobacteraceae bacterium]
MQSSGGVNRWFTAAELADMGLPGLGRDKRRINELANAGRWALRHDARGEALARPRRGRGGGLEYHASCLPPAAMADLARRGLRTAPEPVEVKQNHL